jgi:polyisoprenoid-binding protein YceI
MEQNNIKWVIDPMHSELSFKVKHLVISTVTGFFKTFSGEVFTSSEDNFEGASVSFSANIDSIDTNQSDRDNHLKSAEFFDVENHPTMDFVGKIMGDKLIGDLTIKGITETVSLDIQFGGSAVDFYGQSKAGFELETKISRKEFGLTWSAVTEAGSVVVSDVVRILGSVQLIKQA